jgi:glycosyltransferase involved in cell wall biosynthesis
MRVVMFVYNPLSNDSRVFREAGALVAQGHTVDLIGWKRKNQPAVEERDGFTIRRIFRDPVNKRMTRFLSRLWRLSRRLPGNVVRRLIPAARRRRREAEPADSAPGWPTPQKRRSFLYRQMMLLDYTRRALKLVRELPPADVYQSHDLNTLPLGASAARRAGVPLVYDSHEIFIERQMISPMERRLWRRIEQRLIGRADRVITVCDPIAEELSRRYRIETPMVLLNCPDLPEHRPEASPERLREKAQLVGSNEPIVLYQGMIQPERGLEHLVEAAKQLKRGAVVMMGSGRSMSKLQETIDAENLGDRVRLTGPVPPEELLSYTAGATIGVAPIDGKSLNSYWISPNKLFEYLAAGLPVVATRMPVMEKVVEEHEVGLLCDPGDADGLADAINRLLEDRELYERLRRNAIEASKLFNWQQESKKFLALYTEMGFGSTSASVKELV